VDGRVRGAERMTVSSARGRLGAPGGDFDGETFRHAVDRGATTVDTVTTGSTPFSAQR
jgi:hypothetical protein